MKLSLICTLLLVVTFLSSCKKNWLDAKPQKSLLLPVTIADYQAILDNGSSIDPNAGEMAFNVSQAGLNEVGAGDFYVDSAGYASSLLVQRNAYIWASEIFPPDESSLEWNYPYKRIFYANIILEGIDKIIPKNNNESKAWNNVKGAALFFRAYNHYNIAQIFCKPYNSATAQNDLGIPLRLTSDIHAQSVRATVLETYIQILSDLKQSAELLPVTLPDNQLYKVRPTKVAAYAMQARVYLSMQNYDSALFYSDKTLQLFNSLIDYNTITNLNTSNTPFPRFNAEVIFHMAMSSYSIMGITKGIIDSTLYRSYASNDLRSVGFFRLNNGMRVFKGSYNQSTATNFGGLATDEIYLIRAESNARKGNTLLAMNDLNHMLRHRWKKVNNLSTYTDQIAASPEDALNKILLERRKELLFRGLRWTDLRRLNMDPKYAVTLTRRINSQTYTLLPNDPKYVYPIPYEVILLAKMEQNPR